MSAQKEIGPFSGKQKPVNEGVYKRLFKGQTEKVWCLFSHGRWYCSSYRYAEAKREVWPSNYQEAPWWGVEKS